MAEGASQRHRFANTPLIRCFYARNTAFPKPRAQVRFLSGGTPKGLLIDRFLARRSHAALWRALIAPFSEPPRGECRRELPCPEMNVLDQLRSFSYHADQLRQEPLVRTGWDNSFTLNFDRTSGLTGTGAARRARRPATKPPAHSGRLVEGRDADRGRSGGRLRCRPDRRVADELGEPVRPELPAEIELSS
jgi:hypothetical protein